MEWYLQVFKKYADFSGRARRQEYWMFFLINFLVCIVLGGVVPFILGQTLGTIVYLVYCLAIFIPSLAVGVRRLHDTNRSGWWTLISFVPLIGAIVLLVFFATEGTRGDNQFGADPKAA